MSTKGSLEEEVEVLKQSTVELDALHTQLADEISAKQSLQQEIDALKQQQHEATRTAAPFESVSEFPEQNGASDGLAAHFGSGDSQVFTVI